MSLHHHPPVPPCHSQPLATTNLPSVSAGLSVLTFVDVDSGSRWPPSRAAFTPPPVVTVLPRCNRCCIPGFLFRRLSLFRVISGSGSRQYRDEVLRFPTRPRPLTGAQPSSQPYLPQTGGRHQDSPELTAPARGRPCCCTFWRLHKCIPTGVRCCYLTVSRGVASLSPKAPALPPVVLASPQCLTASDLYCLCGSVFSRTSHVCRHSGRVVFRSASSGGSYASPTSSCGFRAPSFSVMNNIPSLVEPPFIYPSAHRGLPGGF